MRTARSIKPNKSIKKNRAATVAGERSAAGADPRPVAWIIRAVLLLIAIAFLILPLLPMQWFIGTHGKYIIGIHRSHFTSGYFHDLWGLLGAVFVPVSIRVMFLLSVVASCFVPILPGSSPATSEASPRPWRWLCVPLAAIVAFVFFYALRVPNEINSTFGDCPALTKQLAADKTVFAAEVLMMHTFHGVRWLLTELTGKSDGVVIGGLTSCLMGAFFVAAMATLAISFGRNRRERVVVFSGAVLAGYTGQFFGYIETTSGVLAFMAWFFACADRTLRAQTSRGRHGWLIASAISLGLAMMFHAAGIILIPAMAMLMMALAHEKIGRISQSWRGLFDWRAIVIILAFTLLPFYLVVLRPFYFQGEFGNVTHGADIYSFVPWDWEAARQKSPWVYYQMISLLHAYDIASAILIAAPLALVMLLGAAWLAWRARERWELPDGWMVIVTGSAAAGGLLLVCIWHFDFAIWGDWNIASAYLFPLNLAGWLAFITALRHSNRQRGIHLGLLAPMILVQTFCALGILLQLYRKL